MSAGTHYMLDFTQHPRRRTIFISAPCTRDITGLPQSERAVDLPWWNWTLQALGLLSSYVGAELNSRMDIRGFYVWILSNIVLLVLHAASGLWVLCVLDVAYFRVNVRGIAHWHRAMPLNGTAASGSIRQNRPN